MSRILVTGSSGLLGRHVAEALVRAGHVVTGLDIAPPPENAAWAHVTGEADALAVVTELAMGMSALVHIAAVPRPTGRVAADVFRINMAAMYAAVEAARLARIPRFVYASSFSVLGYPFFEKKVVPPYLPVDEGHPPGAQDVYAVTKWLGEEMVEAAVRRGIFSAVSLRMPWIQTPETFHAAVGPRRRQAEAARDLWAYLDARDAADAFVAAVERPVLGHQRLFLSATDSYMERPSFELVAEAYPGTPVRKPLEGTAALIDISAARQELGFAPRFSWRGYPAPAKED
ncbi:NAD-dependent epimerase/dehydratase family protein [Rhizobium leguminosarum]|uniref:NAD-dependent epimerase/dehydratase family protein n=1 Tax=Rhizobium leguminosarum TaxID=384 RepID=UPI0013D9681F|nr:NAD(P)-dependent oxidoreductase [Rhizobium leguminosarum]NEK37381.1 NAD-dependent epimerase/dehydratase family protein [Rhizobium leguminosarum]